MLEPLLAIVWHTLHLLATIYELWCLLKITLHALVLRSYDFCRTNAARERSETAILENCAKQLSKLPMHLCVIVAPESKQVDSEVFRRLFTYALKMGIQCVSVYDTRSGPNSGYVDLQKLVPPQDVHKEASDCGKERYVITWISSNDKTTSNGVYQKHSVKNGVTNGHIINEGCPNGHITSEGCLNGHTTSDRKSEVHSLKIHEINAGDGHALIAQVCRELHGARTTPAVQALLEDRTKLSQHIDKTLQKHLGITEPELGIIFSRLTCTYGALPWHIRFTEFHRLPSERYFNASTFAEVLYKYSRCEQRWGK